MRVARDERDAEFEREKRDGENPRRGGMREREKDGKLGNRKDRKSGGREGKRERSRSVTVAHEGWKKREGQRQRE